MFLPATFERGCDILMDHPRLAGLGAPLKVVFVRKMYRAGPNDQADPHLDQFVIEVASRAGHNLPLR